MAANNSSLVGLTLPTGYPCGGTITIVAVTVEPLFTDRLPVITCELKWDTGNPVLDEGTTLGTLAPGTYLWRQLTNTYNDEHLYQQLTQVDC